MMLQPNEHTGSRRKFTKTILVTCKPSVIKALQIVMVNLPFKHSGHNRSNRDRPQILWLLWRQNVWQGRYFCKLPKLRENTLFQAQVEHMTLDFATIKTIKR